MAMSRSLAGTSLMRLPFNKRSPEVMGSSPAIMRRMEDLPHPDGPSNTMNSPSATVKLTFFTARSAWPLYSLWSLSTVTTAMRFSLVADLLPL